MKIENHILTILQLYEYAMAIGKSLDYKESCESFLKLILKRKNLNAAWILEEHDGVLKSTYAIPYGSKQELEITREIRELFNKSTKFSLLTDESILNLVAPMELGPGNIVIFDLQEQGFLFLYSKKDNVDAQDLRKLQPVIDKFSNALRACRVFEQQQQLLQHLEVRNQELSDYAHMVSHDLKSPLRSIDTLTAWIAEDYHNQFDTNGQQQLNEIRNSVEKMDTLIKGILDYSTIDKDRADSYEVDLNVIVKEVINSVFVPSHIKIISETLPKVQGDKYRLLQLFQNLIDNAIKYNNKEAGIVEISSVDKGDFWEFAIRDNGKGIHPKYFDKIFKTFEKLENSASSTGIGLSIVKKIIQVYGGQIWLDSKPGEGTTFFFTLKK